MIPLSGIANFLPTRRFGSQNKFRAFFLIRKQICWAGHFPQQLEHTSKFPAVYFIDFAGCFTKREWKDHSWKNTAPILKSRNSTETTLSELTMTKTKREFGVLGVSVIMYPSKRCSVEKLWNPIRVLRCFLRLPSRLGLWHFKLREKLFVAFADKLRTCILRLEIQRLTCKCFGPLIFNCSAKFCYFSTRKRWKKKCLVFV